MRARPFLTFTSSSSSGSRARLEDRVSELRVLEVPVLEVISPSLNSLPQSTQVGHWGSRSAI